METKNCFSEYSEYTSRSCFDFAAHSSIGCGGVAKLAFYPQSVAELISLVEKLNADGIKYYVLGNLTNVLPPDGECERAVICTKRLDGVTLGSSVFAYAGATSGVLLRVCKRAKKGGAEFLSGIPCTLGGALFMNAGAGGKYISEIVESVLVLRKGKTQILNVRDCRYDYKKSIFMENGDIILGASLRLDDASDEQIRAEEKYYLDRRAHLPKGKSMGCVFKNPESGFAGAYIEGSGLKGFRLGGAKISETHGNFIINDNGATSENIRALIAIAKNAVYAQYGVALEEEIRYL